MRLPNLSPAALQDGLTVGGNVVAGGPELLGRRGFQPQSLTGHSLVDAVIRAQQRTHGALVVADDAVRNLARRGA